MGPRTVLMLQPASVTAIENPLKKTSPPFIFPEFLCCRCRTWNIFWEEYSAVPSCEIFFSWCVCVWFLQSVAREDRLTPRWPLLSKGVSARKMISSSLFHSVHRRGGHFGPLFYCNILARFIWNRLSPRWVPIWSDHKRKIVKSLRSNKRRVLLQYLVHHILASRERK